MSLGRLRVEKTGFRHMLDAFELVRRADCEDCDAAEVWCSDWMSLCTDSSATEETKAQTAKTALSRMKSAAKALTALSTSLQETIQLVTTQSELSFRCVGISSLPDDLLSRVFELCIREDDSAWGPISDRVANQLAFVSQRFRRVALQTARLWRDVCNLRINEWILQLKQRCTNPVVHLRYRKPVIDSADFFQPRRHSSPLDEFVQLLHPATQWRGLDVDCYEENLTDVIRLISKRLGGDFGRMESLRIRSGMEIEDEWNGEDEALPLTDNLSDDDASRISKWKLPSLRVLKIENFLPKRINCSTLRQCELKLSRDQQLVNWDLHALRGFLRAIHHVESLSFILINANYSRENYNADAEPHPITFSNLTSLRIEFGLRTAPNFVKSVMDAIDAADTLHTLEVAMNDYHDYQKCEAYHCLNAIFTTSTSGGVGEPRRTLSNVKTLNLHLDTSHKSDWPIYDMLEALPRLENLWLDIPSWCIVHHARILSSGNLRTIHLEDQPPTMGVSLIGSAFACQSDWVMEKLTTVELGGFNHVSNCMETLEKLLGGKLVKA